MFKEYLEDSNKFFEQALAIKDGGKAKRYYRVSVFCVISAVESFINYIADTLTKGSGLQPYEIAFLIDRKFDLSGNSFQIIDQIAYNKFEDKLKFLIYKYVPGFDFEHEPSWCRLLELKKFRDELTHPRQDEDEIDVKEYEKKIRAGLSAAIEIMNSLCLGIFKRPLRKKILELKL